MNFENDPRLPDNPMSDEIKPRSSKKWWLISGCGCLSMIGLLCVVGGGFIWIQFIKPYQEFKTENINLATSLEQVKDKIGEPIEKGTVVEQQTETPGVIEIRTPVSGPTGSGTIVLRGKLNVGGEGKEAWTRESLYLEIDGQRFELDPKESIPDLNIDLGL